MRRNLCFFFFLLLIAFSGQCQQSAKGFAKLDKNDLPKAAGIFKESLIDDDQDLLANYGMAIVCSNNMYEKHDYFSAFRYIRNARNIVSKKNDIQLSDLEKKVPDLKVRITKDYDIIEGKLYDSVRKNPRIETAEIFANEFPDSKYFNDIIQFRDNLEFKKLTTSESSTVKDYDLYIERFPSALDRDNAVKLRDRTAYGDLLKDLTLRKVYDYIYRYPKSELFQRVAEIRDSLEFVKASQNNTLDSLGYYLSHFPSSAYNGKVVEKYIQRYYEQIQVKNTQKDYQDFLNRFLGSERAQEALNLRDYLIFQEIQNTNTVETYNRFISWYPNSAKLKQAIQIRDQRAFEEAKTTNTIPGFEDFIYHYPASAQVRSAFRLRDSLVLVEISHLIDLKLIDQSLHQYPTLAQSPEVLKIKAPIAFKEAEKTNTREGWEQFLLYYSNTEFEIKAKANLAKIK